LVSKNDGHVAITVNDKLIIFGEIIIIIIIITKIMIIIIQF